MLRVSIQYSNSAGLKVIGSHNRISEILILDTDWLGTLDYPPLEIGFGADDGTAITDLSDPTPRQQREEQQQHGYTEEKEEEEQQHGEEEEKEEERKGTSLLSPLPPLRMYPRNPEGVNNSITKATIKRFGNAGIVTSQVRNLYIYIYI